MPYSTAQRTFIPDGGINDIIKEYHDKKAPREQSVASPSTLTECPRVVWFKKHDIPRTNEQGWGQKQRMMLGRIAENLFADQLREAGKLLWHWKDDVPGESVKFGMGGGLSRLEGTPDLLINLDGKVLISDAKTSRADSFAYVPIDDTVWADELWYKYKLQVEAYYLLCHKNKGWFKKQYHKDNNGNILVAKVGKYAGAKIYDRDELPPPEACHLFSYALDDGVVKREFTWQPTQKTAAEIIHYTNRWNKAYQSEDCPACQCTETQTKFCPFATETERTKSGYKLGIKCCGDELIKETK